jgi:hypothetical protein
MMALPGRFNLRVKMEMMVTLLSSDCRDDEGATPEENLDDALHADFAVYVTDYVQTLTGTPFASTNETAYTLPYGRKWWTDTCSCDDFYFSHS